MTSYKERNFDGYLLESRPTDRRVPVRDLTPYKTEPPIAPQEGVNTMNERDSTEARQIVSEWENVLHSATDHDAAHNDLIDRITNALTTARAEAVQWLPIDTAPKDGRTLLLGYYNRSGKWRTVRGQWFSEEQIAEDWEEPEDGEAGWYETSVEAEPPNCWPINPTRYQPLPAPPTALQGKESK